MPGDSAKGNRGQSDQPTLISGDAHAQSHRIPVLNDANAGDRPIRPNGRRLSHHDIFGHSRSHCDEENCTHGEISPHASSTRSYGSFTPPQSVLGFRGPYPRDSESGTGVLPLADDPMTEALLGNRKKMSTTQWLVQRHGVKNTRFMYIDYYIPFLRWIKQYKWSFFAGDLVAAFTMASFYIPMALSYASNLGHLPPINGLYSFVFNPLIYAFLGTCPQMVVGPEAAGSLLTGNVVRDSIAKGHSGDEDSRRNAEVAGVVTGIAGAVLLIAGGARLGFLDNVLSRPFLRGFISAIGIVILVDQLIPEMGLSQRATIVGGVSHGSCLAKLVFVLKNFKSAHGLTCAASFSSLAIILICRETKNRLQKRYPSVSYFPDRFLVVVLYTILSWQLNWEDKGVPILGDVKSGTGTPFRIHFPFNFSHIKDVESVLSTAFIVALLGFFESSVAAKSLGAGPNDGIQNISLSANRELVALGTANIVGGIFMALPAFGGYGRSKVNAQTGGKTPMSSILLSLLTLICVYFMLPYFYYIPKGVLSAMVSVVAYSLIEEAPHDLHFFWMIRGWSELFLIFIVFAATIFYSLSLGIGCGIGFSVLRVIKHSTRPRIQILGRVHGTTDQFENAEANPDRLEFIEGCLIVKIPEPLTFANTGDLRSRLRRLENYGAVSAHPALPRVRREEHNKNIIFDVHGVTELDGAGAQILLEILEAYREKGVRIFFCRVPSHKSKVWKLFVASGIIAVCGGSRHFVPSVQEALNLTELESVTEHFRDHPEDGEIYDIP